MPTTLISDGHGGLKPPDLNAGQVFRVNAPNFPEFVFEYHPETKRVYVARQNVAPVIGELLADNVPSHGDAINAVMIWLRGYRTALVSKADPRGHVRGLDI